MDGFKWNENLFYLSTVFRKILTTSLLTHIELYPLSCTYWITNDRSQARKWLFAKDAFLFWKTSPSLHFRGSQLLFLTHYLLIAKTGIKKESITLLLPLLLLTACVKPALALLWFVFNEENVAVATGLPINADRHCLVFHFSD